MTVIDVIIFVDNQINECGYQEESGSSENIDSMCSFIPEEHPNPPYSDTCWIRSYSRFSTDYKAAQRKGLGIRKDESPYGRYEIMCSVETPHIDIFDVESILISAPKSPCQILQCDNPHTETLTVCLEDKTGDVFICDKCKQRHIQETLYYFFFEDEKGLDIKIVYFPDDDELNYYDTAWEYVGEQFFMDLLRYKKEPTGDIS